jgi:hypothetical protein
VPAVGETETAYRRASLLVRFVNGKLDSLPSDEGEAHAEISSRDLAEI